MLRNSCATLHMHMYKSSFWICLEKELLGYRECHCQIVLPRRKCLFILWLQSPSTVILEAKKIKSVIVPTFSPSICDEVMGLHAMIFIFWMLSFKPAFSLPLSPSSRRSLVLLHFLPLEWYHLHIWGCWHFSQQSWFQLGINSTWHFTWCTLHIS